MAEQVKLLGKKLRGILPGKAQFNLLDEYTPRVLSTGGGEDSSPNTPVSPLKFQPIKFN